MEEDPILGEAIVRAVIRAGFALDAAYADVVEMTLLIRRIEEYVDGTALTDGETMALLENLRRVFLKTAIKGWRPSIESQSRLRNRWRFLRAVSPTAADAYIAALRVAGIEPPEYLLHSARDN